MPYTLTMPKMSPTMEEGSIAKWHKSEGEYVKAGDLLLEVSTDKATVEYNALDAGWLRKILLPEGGEGIVNQPIAIMTEEKDETIEGYVPVGDVKVASPAVQPQVVQQVEKTPVQQPEPLKPLPKAPVDVSSMQPKLKKAVSPLARRLAKEKGIDVSHIKGTGAGGRVMSRDLENIESKTRKIKSTFPEGAFQEEPMNPIRKVIAKRLQEAKATIPHFYVSCDIDAMPLLSVKSQLAELGHKVSVNDCIIKAVASALESHPEINSGFNPQNQTLIRFQTIDLSIAVSAESGLITPIVRYADQKSLLEISAEVKALADKAKSGKLQPNEFVGGSFTISNLGMYGVSSFQAIINPPQGAILSVSGVQEVPVIKDGSIVPGKVLSLSVSADHRVMDGVAVAKFLNTLKKHLENPISVLL